MRHKVTQLRIKNMRCWTLALAAVVGGAVFAGPVLSADQAVAAASAPTPVGWGPHGKKLYYFMVFSNPTPGNDEELNRWYDRIHAPMMIESGDFVWAQRFMLSPEQFGGRSPGAHQYLVIFAVETNNITKAIADANRRMMLPRNVRSESLDYKSLQGITYEAIGPMISQKEAQRRLAKETKLGHVPPPGAPAPAGFPPMPPPGAQPAGGPPPGAAPNGGAPPADGPILPAPKSN
jgi:hypothetical protein